MIQYIGHIKIKREQTIFILFISQQIQVKDITKVNQCFIKYIKITNANSLLFNSNKPKFGLKKRCFG